MTHLRSNWHFVFEDKMSKPVSGSVALGDKIIPLNLLRAVIFYPTKNQNHQTVTFSHRHFEEIATTMLIELRDPQNATATHLSSVMGKYS